MRFGVKSNVNCSTYDILNIISEQILNQKKPKISLRHSYLRGHDSYRDQLTHLGVSRPIA